MYLIWTQISKEVLQSSAVSSCPSIHLETYWYRHRASTTRANISSDPDLLALGLVLDDDLLSLWGLLLLRLLVLLREDRRIPVQLHLSLKFVCARLMTHSEETSTPSDTDSHVQVLPGGPREDHLPAMRSNRCFSSNWNLLLFQQGPPFQKEQGLCLSSESASFEVHIYLFIIFIYNISLITNPNPNPSHSCQC